MKVTLVRHGTCGKSYWFGVPDNLVSQINTGAYVSCDTSRGKKYGIVVGGIMDESDVKEVMTASGATFPLRNITSVAHNVAMNFIKIPEYMKRSRPSDDKIAKRFLEYYHRQKFDTKIEVADDGTLHDGYTAYLVAKMLKLPYISAVCSSNVPVYTECFF